jgi:hypothetical protein
MNAKSCHLNALIAFCACIFVFLNATAEASPVQAWPTIRYEQQLLYGLPRGVVPDGTRLQFLSLGLHGRYDWIVSGLEFTVGRNAHPSDPGVHFMAGPRFFSGLGAVSGSWAYAAQTGIAVLMVNQDCPTCGRRLPIYPDLQIPFRVGAF